MVLVEENRTWTGGATPAIGLGFNNATMPFLHGLAAACTHYANWSETNGSQNSLSQYVGMTSGVANPNTVNDCTPSVTCNSTDDNIFRQVRVANGTARTYVEDASSPCSAGTNAAKHIPALYYWGGDDQSHCATEVLPLTALDTNNLPTFAMIVPNLCNDGHDCSDTVVDTWAQTHLSGILNSAAYAAGHTLVVVVYDEDQPVPNVVIAPTAQPGINTTTTASHASLLKTVQEMLALPAMTQGQMSTALSLRSSAHI